MGAQHDDGIGWCHYTHNCWEGCEKISPACKHCYAAALNAWLHRGENWGPDSPRRFFGEAHWAKPLAWNRAAAAAGERRRVFCGSIMDIGELHVDADTRIRQNDARARLWGLIEETPNLDWLLLTKRIDELAQMLPWVGGHSDPWPNVWVGVTAENEEWAWRIDKLAAVPARRRFVSYEPALGWINWAPRLRRAGRPDLVIFGDESGGNRRGAAVEWADQTMAECEAAGVAFYFKQWHGPNAGVIEGDRDKHGKIRLPIFRGKRRDAMPGIAP